MKRKNITHILMHRPHLLNLPKVAPLPTGYELKLFNSEIGLKSLITILSAAFDEPWNEERVQSKLTQAPDVRSIYIVTWRGQPVATASSRWLPERFPDSGVVHWVGTHPDYARQGLSSILIDGLLHDFIARGYKDAVLETDDSRIPAIRLYLKFGFLPVYNVNGEDHHYRWSVIFQAMFGG